MDRIMKHFFIICPFMKRNYSSISFIKWMTSVLIRYMVIFHLLDHEFASNPILAILDHYMVIFLFYMVYTVSFNLFRKFYDII